MILRDYVARNGIAHTITVLSAGYAAVVPGDLTGDDARVVPSFTPSVHSGSALRVVPEQVGRSLAEVLTALDK